MNRLRTASPRAASALRGGLVLLTILAWLAISNHCALAALLPGAAGSVPACCAKKMPAQQHAPIMECCRTLPAVDASVAAFTPQVFVTGDFIYAAFATPLATPPRVRFADYLPTGPPAVFAFSEFALQRGHRSQAPPLVG